MATFDWTLFAMRNIWQCHRCVSLQSRHIGKIFLPFPDNFQWCRNFSTLFYTGYQRTVFKNIISKSNECKHCKNSQKYKIYLNSERTFSLSCPLRRTLRGRTSTKMGRLMSAPKSDCDDPCAVSLGKNACKRDEWTDKGFAGTFRITESFGNETIKPEFQANKARSNHSAIPKVPGRNSSKNNTRSFPSDEGDKENKERSSSGISERFRELLERKKKLERMTEWEDMSDEIEETEIPKDGLKRQKFSEKRDLPKRTRTGNQPQSKRIGTTHSLKTRDKINSISNQQQYSEERMSVSADLLEAEKGEWRRNLKMAKNVGSPKGKKNRNSEVPSTANGNDLLYGISPCLLALQFQRREIKQVYVTTAFKESERSEVRQILAILEERGCRVWTTSRKVLDKMVQHRPHQGICMETSRLYFNSISVEVGPPQEGAVKLILDQIKDPMNLGAVLRSAYFLGTSQVIVSKKNCCSLTPVVSKASSGVMEIIPVYASSNLPAFLLEEQAKGWKIVGASLGRANEAKAVTPCHEYRKTSPTILVIGSEGFGLSTDIKRICSEFISIPAGRQLHSGIDSLNVSVATGILLHTLLGKA